MNYQLEQIRKLASEQHNKMKEQNERREHYLNQQSQSVPDFRQLYKDMSEDSQNRVNSVISKESAEVDFATVLAKYNVHKHKDYMNAFERIFNNTLSAYQLREIAKNIEMIIDDIVKNVTNK